MPIPDSQINIWEMNKLQQRLYWVPEEVQLSEDKRQWHVLDPREKRFLSRILAFFAAADLLICENLECNFESEVRWNSVKAFYKGQNNMEMIHAEVYSNMLLTLVPSKSERDSLVTAFETIDSVKAKHQWALRYMNPNGRTFPERLVAFCIFEGLMFASSFAAIYFFKHERNGLLPGICHANELISRDEGLHAHFAAMLYRDHVYPSSTLVDESIKKLSDKYVHSLFESAIKIENSFIKDAIPVEMLGMNASLMCQYIKFVANKLLRTLGHSELYNNIKNPFLWMASTALTGQTNFFERRVTEYSKPVISDELVTENLFNADSKEF